MRGMREMLNIPIATEDVEYLERRTKRAIEEFSIDNLMDYTVDSAAGYDLGDFYKTVVEGVLIENVYVAISEISGKYNIVFEFEGEECWCISSYHILVRIFFVSIGVI
jgi:hypothetical protein